MEYFLLKTKHNDQSENFAQVVSAFGFGETVIEEIFDIENNHIRVSGVQCVPSLVALAEIDGALVCVHEASQISDLAAFAATAASKYAELTE